MAVNQELKSIIKTIKFREGVTQDIIAAKLGVQPTYLSDAINGRVVFSDALRERIYEQYSYIKNESEMLVNATEVVEAEEIQSDVLPIKCDKQTLGHCRATMPFVSNDIVQSRDIDIRSLVEKSPEELEQFTLSKVFKGGDYIQKVITEAMEPYYFPGDYLLVHFMPAQGDILSGATYLVDTKVYGAMLRKVYVRENGYTLKPHNPEFEEVFIERENVYSIGIVVSMFRTNTNLTLASNLSTLVKNRDEQIKRMVEAQQQMLDELCRQNDRLDKERERTERERERTDKLIEKLINN